MSGIKSVLVCFLLIVLTFLAGCSKTEEITQAEGGNMGENSPSISNFPNSFSISVKAKLYNYAVEYQIDFTKTSLNLAVSIDNVTTGDVTIQVFNDTKQMLYKIDFTQNTSLAQIIDLDEKPTKIKFIFNNFSANFNCSLIDK